MSRGLRRGPLSSAHDRALELAALRLDEPLGDADARWLDGHLATCSACSVTAAAYADDSVLLRSLRSSELAPPRDLWARTAAAIEADSGGGIRRPAPVRRVGVLQLAPVAGLAIVVVLVGAGLVGGGLLVADKGSGPDATPITLTAANVQVVRQGENGALELQTGTVDRVCPLAAGSCLVQPTVETAPLMALAPSDSIEASILSPDRDRMVLVQRGNGATGVFVVPVGQPAAPTTAPVHTPPASPTVASPAVTGPVTPPPAETPAPTDSATPAAETPSPAVATASPGSAEQPSPSGEPTVAPSDGPVTTLAPAETPAPTSRPEPTPTIGVTPLPDGAIAIARDVVVVGAAAYDAKGKRFAFSARPSDGSRGPDVYIWQTGDPVAGAVTTDHSSVFSGWQDGHLLVSRVVDGRTGTYLVDPVAGAPAGSRTSAAWRPTAGPNGNTAVWWDGDVKPAADGVTPVPASGRLVLGPWGDAGGDTQVLEDKKVPDWEARWDPTGSVLAIWIAGDKATDPGRLSLYRIDPGTGRARLASPMFKDEPAYEGFNLDSGRVVFPAPGPNGGKVMRIAGWSGDNLGWSDLPADAGTTVVRQP
jgi:hypothetical protein